VLLLVAVVALVAASGTNAAKGETTVKLRLIPCFPVGEAHAGGEAEWESDTQILKVEVSGATDLAGRTLNVFVDVLRDGVRVRLLVGSLTIDRAGGAATADEFGLEVLDIELEQGTDVFSSDPSFC